MSLFLPFLLALGVAVIATGFAGVMRWRSARIEAPQAYAVWADRSGQEPVDEAVFVRAYLNVHGPRGQYYVLGAGLAAIIITPIAFIMLPGIWHLGWVASGEPAAYTPRMTLIWQFYMFFGLIGVWAGVAALAAYLFHARRPGPLDAEVKRLAQSSTA